jgi:hypothetical protein
MTKPANDPGVPTKWQIVLGVEAVALMIALIMPVTPSGTGADGSLAASGG